MLSPTHTSIATSTQKLSSMPVLMDLEPYSQKQSETSETANIIACASRALSDVERRYSQTEREALAVVWSTEHFHLYVYGSRFGIITDHKPLVSVFDKPTHTSPARIERWRVRLHAYDVTVKYRPGAENPADYLSRHADDNNTKQRLPPWEN